MLDGVKVLSAMIRERDVNKGGGDGKDREDKRKKGRPDKEGRK